MLVDGAALINMLKPSGACKSFSDYANQVYKPYIMKQLENVDRIDVIFDRYLPNSLKAQAREKRGKGVRRRVQADVKLPANWSNFLKVDENKTELFQYLAEVTTAIEIEGKCILCTSDTSVLSSSVDVEPHISPCTHEEADTRLILHSYHCAVKGFKSVTIRTVDSDVVVLAISYFHLIGLKELWISFGVGKQYRYIAIHEIVKALGPEKSSVVYVFHALTGCDQTSAFLGRGKVTAWKIWMSSEEMTDVFKSLSRQPTPQDISDVMPKIERFVVLMYERTSQS